MRIWNRYQVGKMAFMIGLSFIALCANLKVAGADDIVDALDSLSNNRIVNRQVSLADLGITTPLSLSSSETTQDIYFPVPAGVPLVTPRFTFDGSYFRSDGGYTAYALSFDGNTVATRSPNGERGKSHLEIEIDGVARNNGFVRFGVDWSSSVDLRFCDGTYPIGNQLIVQTASFLEYGYRASDVKTIASAFTALPQKVTVMVPGGTLNEAEYDAAWRLGVALERSGKVVEFVAIPAINDTFDTTEINVPEELMSIPAFAAFAGGGAVKIENSAQVGALILLGAPSARADFAVSSTNLITQVDEALLALAEEVVTAEPKAEKSFWALARKQNSLDVGHVSEAIRIGILGGQPIISIAPDAAKEAAGLFNSFWRKSATTSEIVVENIRTAPADIKAVPLTASANFAANLEVVARGEWTSSFNLGDNIPYGTIPIALDIQVSAAPGATSTKPVASIFLNGTLLGAKQLVANGLQEKISVPVPFYTLRPQNVLIVRFQRQPASDHCRELPQAFPVSVLPGSIMRLGPSPKAVNFTAIAPWLSGNSMVGVHSKWLNSALTTLPNVVEIAKIGGISAQSASFSIIDANNIPEPNSPYLIFGATVDGENNRTAVSGNSVSILSENGKVLFEASRMANLAVLSVVTGGKQPGMTYQTIGDGPTVQQPIQLGAGDVAIIGDLGVVSEIKTTGSYAPWITNPALLNSDLSLGSLTVGGFVLQKLPSIITAMIIGGFALLLILAYYAKRRKKNH